MTCPLRFSAGTHRFSVWPRRSAGRQFNSSLDRNVINLAGSGYTNFQWISTTMNDVPVGCYYVDWRFMTDCSPLKSTVKVYTNGSDVPFCEVEQLVGVRSFQPNYIIWRTRRIYVGCERNSVKVELDFSHTKYRPRVGGVSFDYVELTPECCHAHSAPLRLEQVCCKAVGGAHNDWTKLPLTPAARRLLEEHLAQFPFQHSDAMRRRLLPSPEDAR